MYGPIKYSYEKFNQIVQLFFYHLVSKIVDKNTLIIPRFCKIWLEY